MSELAAGMVQYELARGDGSVATVFGVTSGLAMLTGLPPGTRGIAVKISTEYFKKARGLLVAETHCELPQVQGEDMDYVVQADIRDRDGDVVARTTACWRLGPV